MVIDTDPDVIDAAIDTGFTTDDGTLRAPDIAVGVPEVAGWVKGTPPLAVEYAGVGQDEDALQRKISDLLAAGTRFIWVVRLVGLRRVEVYTNGAPTRVVDASGTLTAPGILRKPVPVRALYDREVAHERALENLLERQGYATLDDVRDEARAEGREEGREEGQRAMLLDLLRSRFGALPDAIVAAVTALDQARIRDVFHRAVSAPDLVTLFPDH